MLNAVLDSRKGELQEGTAIEGVEKEETDEDETIIIRKAAPSLPWWQALAANAAIFVAVAGLFAWLVELPHRKGADGQGDRDRPLRTFQRNGKSI